MRASASTFSLPRTAGSLMSSSALLKNDFFRWCFCSLGISGLNGLKIILCDATQYHCLYLKHDDAKRN